MKLNLANALECIWLINDTWMHGSKLPSQEISTFTRSSEGFPHNLE
jgi:hypothetical protein